LQPVYDKPMIYYPLATLLESGIYDILLISTPQHMPRFKDLLGDGSQWGISLSYAIQERPGGIAQSILIGRDFIDDEQVALILGDNIFHGDLGLMAITSTFTEGALIFGYPVVEPSRYGVVQIGEDGRAISLEEKPVRPKSNLAVPGFYVYDQDVVAITEKLRPSSRGELEITDVNREYLYRGDLQVIRLGRGIAWLDSGTHDSLLDAANFIATVEHRQGLKIACLEEVALRLGFVDEAHVERILSTMPQSNYKEYLERILTDPSYVR
jgi:glucose-1-phosphate thymidylyltransferase